MSFTFCSPDGAIKKNVSAEAKTAEKHNNDKKRKNGDFDFMINPEYKILLTMSSS